MFSFARIRFATTRSSSSVPLPAGAGVDLVVCPASTTVIAAIATSVTTTRMWFFIRMRPLLEKILHFRDARPRTGVIHFQVRPGAADCADGVVADLDRHAAAQREDVCKVALRRGPWIFRRPLLKLHGRNAEHACGVSLASRHVR